MSNIVFILGAGASIPYGYPSGPALVNQILDTLHPRYIHKIQLKAKILGSDRFSSSELTQSFSDQALYLKHGFDQKLIEYFSNSLSMSNKDSIDSFLLERKEFYEIGKFAIANCILKCENPTVFQDSNGNWLRYLWNKINLSKSAFSFHNIAFISFNYDRVLEYFFYTSLKHSFNLKDDEINDLLNSKPILHLHGTVGHLPWQDSENGFEYYFSGSDIETYYHRVSEASKNIRIIHDEVNATKDVSERAFELMNTSDRIYIIGLGFQSLNLERLRIK